MPVDMLPGPELEADERPDAFGVIARSVLVLLQQSADFAGVRPAALRRVRIEQDVARPVDHLFVQPSPQRNAEAALRSREHFLRHPWTNDIAEEPLGRLRVTVAV